MTDIALDEKLAPCPHCGGKATSWPEAHSDENPNEVIAPSVTKCDDCGAMVYGDWQDESVAAWNRRTSPSQVAPANPAQVTDAMVEAALVIFQQRMANAVGKETIRAALSAAIGASPPHSEDVEAQIKRMVERFLSWKLPKDFNPDGGISFKREFNERTPPPMIHQPYGTNLFDYGQAKVMVEHMLEGFAAIGAGGQVVAYEPCGGCGEKNPDKRCIGCLHPFSALSQPHPADERVVEALEECHGLDTPERVCFYEQDFYVLSNFSAFSIMWEKSPREGLIRFDTSEAVYHWMKFKPNIPTAEQYRLMEQIRLAPSAHEAFKIAERNKHLRRPDWDDVKVGIMRDILRAKVGQHEYVRRKLLATGDRELIENSWRDDFWGWGPNRNGQNMLGKLWMEIRSEIRSSLATEGR